MEILLLKYPSVFFFFINYYYYYFVLSAVWKGLHSFESPI